MLVSARRQSMFTGQAYVTSEAKLLIDDEAFAWGIR